MSSTPDNSQSEDEHLKKLLKEHLTIFDSIPAWIFYKGKDNTFLRVNKAFCEAMGKSKIELEGKSLFDIYPKDQAEMFWKDDKEVIASGQSKKGIIEHADTAAGQRWVRTDKMPYRDESGTIIGVIGFAIDITDQKNAEEMIESSQLMLQKIINLLPTRIFWKDMNLNYLGCNSVFAQDAGKKSVEEIIGKDDYQMGWKDQADLYRKDDMAVIASGKPKINYEEVQTTPNGKKMWLNTNKVPLTDSAGNIIGVLGTYIDVTDRKLADDNLKKALDETKKINEMMIGRELKMVELKKEYDRLKRK